MAPVRRFRAVVMSMLPSKTALDYWIRRIHEAKSTAIILTCLTFGAVAGHGQTLTCTFQFVGSGTIGAQSFTNANVTITTVGVTANVYELSGEYFLNDTSASIAISGVGVFSLMASTGISASLDPTDFGPGTYSQTMSFLISGVAVAEIFNYTDDPWHLLTSIGPIPPTSSNLENWNSLPVITSAGYTLNINSGDTFIPITFQGVFTPGLCAGTPNGTVPDVQAVINEALGLTPATTEMDGDGVVNVVDVQAVTDGVLGCGVTRSGIIGIVPPNHRRLRK